MRGSYLRHISATSWPRSLMAQPFPYTSRPRAGVNGLPAPTPRPGKPSNRHFKVGGRGSNPRPTDYESVGGADGTRRKQLAETSEIACEEAFLAVASTVPVRLQIAPGRRGDAGVSRRGRMLALAKATAGARRHAEESEVSRRVGPRLFFEPTGCHMAFHLPRGFANLRHEERTLSRTTSKSRRIHDHGVPQPLSPIVSWSRPCASARG
jgi:hypothetical protein